MTDLRNRSNRKLLVAEELLFLRLEKGLRMWCMGSWCVYMSSTADEEMMILLFLRNYRLLQHHHNISIIYGDAALLSAEPWASWLPLSEMFS